MNFPPRRTIHPASTIGLGLLLLLMVVNLVISQWNIHRLFENDRLVVETQSILTTLEAVLANVFDAETSERGYLITEDPEYLRSYQSAIAGSARALESLRRLGVDDAVRSRIDPLEERVQARFAELRRAIAAQQEGGFEAARRSVSTNQGRRLMNEMRTLVSEMQKQERDALAARSTESRRSAQLTTLADFVAATTGIGLVGLAYFLFRRELAHRRRADDALRRLGAIVESSDDAIVSKSLNGTIVSWNAGATRIYGYTAGEVIGRDARLLCPPERTDEIQQHLDLVRSGTHIEHFETTRVRKDGQRIDVSLSISPILDDTGAVIGASAISRDVSAQKLLEREVLEIAAREQQRIGQDLHDGTGQELTGLAMMAEQLAGQLQGRSLPEAKSAARIVDGLEQALHHVRALSRGLVPVELDAEGLMAALAGLAKRTSELHAVVCTFECNQPVSIPDVQASTHLYRLSQEAVTNALKHSRARKIRIRLSDDGSLIRLAIVDDGVGIRSADRQQTGMGLRIMQYRAELIRAKLTISTVQPHGTQIACTLPRQPESWRTRGGEHGRPEQSPARVDTPASAVEPAGAAEKI
jgi:PAS domain S-box-containing protein